MEAAFLGQTAPPAGFTEEGGHIEDAGGEIHVVYGTWTQTGAAQRVMYVQRGSGASAAQIVSVFAIPPPRANEMIFSENCTHPDFPEPASRIYASAGTAQQRPGLSDPPSSAWRLDRETGRLLPLDASRVTCAFDHME